MLKEMDPFKKSGMALKLEELMIYYDIKWVDRFYEEKEGPYYRIGSQGRVAAVVYPFEKRSYFYLEILKDSNEAEREDIVDYIMTKIDHDAFF